jgi:chromosomal replication initiator protein
MFPSQGISQLDLPHYEVVGFEGWGDILASYFGWAAYKDWLSQLQLASFKEGTLCFSAPCSFVKDWIEKHYLEAVCVLFQKHFPLCQKVTLIVQDQPLPSLESVGSVAPIPSVPSTPYIGEDVSNLDIKGFVLDDNLTFDNFVVGKPNEFAYAAARRVADCEQAIYNPLFLYGPVGHGKTHLMHSIAHHMLKASGYRKKILYLSAEKFMYYFIRSLRYKNIMAFKDYFRSVDVLMIDDVQFISGKESTQEEFFHTFNALVDQKRQVVISADKSPHDLELQERMKSRLGWGLVADLHPTTFELRLGILESKSRSLKVEVNREILEFLAQRISSNVRELEGALVRVVAHGTLMGTSLTLPLVQNILKDLLRSCYKEVTIEIIQKRVSDYYHLKLSDLISAKRLRSIVRPRQVAMFLSKQLTTASLPSIGRSFGGRDHTTVMHSIETIENLLTRDSSLQEDLNFLRSNLEA